MTKATHIRVGGSWKQVNNVWQRVSGEWKEQVMPHVRVGGAWKECMEYIDIGDDGPGGGVVVYDKGEYTDGWRYIEITKENLTDSKWQDPKSEIGDTSNAVGEGGNNTDIIVAWLDQNNQSGMAAQRCDDLTSGGKSDWVLPSRDDMQQILPHYELIPNMDIDDMFWTSSEVSDIRATAILMGSWGVSWSDTDKKSNQKVKAIRYF